MPKISAPESSFPCLLLIPFANLAIDLLMLSCHVVSGQDIIYKSTCADFITVSRDFRVDKAYLFLHLEILFPSRRRQYNDNVVSSLNVEYRLKLPGNEIIRPLIRRCSVLPSPAYSKFPNVFSMFGITCFNSI